MTLDTYALLLLNTNADPPLVLLAWFLTWLVHSALLLGGAWLFTRSALIQQPKTLRTLWTTALVGGMLTATLHVAAGVDLTVETRGPRDAIVARSVGQYRLGVPSTERLTTPPIDMQAIPADCPETEENAKVYYYKVKEKGISRPETDSVASARRWEQGGMAGWSACRCAKWSGPKAEG